ncbi:hypothetical protein JCM1840_004519 [Sporobolomyces johnsonii]
MWNSLSGGLSTYLTRSTSTQSVAPFPLDSTRDQDALPSSQDNAQLPPSPAQHPHDASPHTPDQRSTSGSLGRLSPNSLSQSGNQIMAGVLSAHPHFSVFRKSASMDEIAQGADDSPLGAGGGRMSLNLDDLRDDAVETLATPPSASPAPTKDSSPSGNSSSSSFHLSSIEGADLSSLNFGDHSSSSIVEISPRPSPARDDPPASQSAGPSSTAGISAGGVRLVPDSPPTSRRSSASSSSSFRPASSAAAAGTKTPSRSSSSSSLSRSTSVARVGQFSPLSLCPSPLLGAPALPPPPPAPFTSPDENEPRLVRKLSNGGGILKAPRTPGTGRSVRFSSSTVERMGMGSVQDGSGEEEDEKDDSPSNLPVSRRRPTFAAPDRENSPAPQAGIPSEGEESYVSSASALNLSSASSVPDDCQHPANSSSILVASFLSKLQAAIPSPDVSLADPGPELPSPPRTSSPTVSHPPASTAAIPQIAFDPSTPSFSSIDLPPSSTSKEERRDPTMLFDESNPFLLSGVGASFLGCSVAGPSGGAPSEGAERLQVLEEEDEDDEDPTTTAPSTPRADPLDSLPQTPSSAGRSTRSPSADDHPFSSGRRLEDGSPLHASDMSSSSSSLGVDVEQQRRDSHSPPPAYASPTPSPSASAAEEEDETEQSATSFRTSPSTPAHPPPSPAPAPPASPALATPSSPGPSSSLTRSSESQSQSFYRRFMASRALLGGSQSAVDEWGRLEKGEKASPKEALSGSGGLGDSRGRKRGVEELEGEGEGDEREGGERSVYYSPAKEESSRVEETGVGLGAEEVEVEALLRRGGSFVELEVGEESVEDEEELEGSIIDHGMGRGAILSPIVEVSEPESNANSPFDSLLSSLNRSRSRVKPPPAQPTFSSSLRTALTAAHTTAAPSPQPSQLALSAPAAPPATPSRSRTRGGAPSTPLSASKIPRPRNPITPSQNPFLLQLTHTANDATSALLQDLFSTQQDQLATSASQRFLLSSLVTNLQNEVEHKDAMVRNLKGQVDDARREVEEVERIAVEWERQARDAASSGSGFGVGSDPTAAAAAAERERKKVAALEETVQLLADELETRLRDDRSARQRLELELERTRAEVAKRANEVRDGEIRLRHARAGQKQAEEDCEVLRRREELARDESERVKREMEALRARWRADVEERERGTQRLREELQARGALDGGEDVEDRIEREVRRRVDDARHAAEREAAIVKHELLLRDSALADLREQNRLAREEVARLQHSATQDRQQAELAFADMASTLAAKEDELAELRDAQASTQDELDEALVKLDDAAVGHDRLVKALQATESELVQQQEQCATALAAMRDLENAVSRIEAESSAKDVELGKVRRELEAQSRESDNVLEKRDRVLAESEKQVGRTRKELEAVRKEKEKLSELVAKLKRDSADREIKVAQLKKRVAELDDDVFGLNIALDAKQQEASHWKRQMRSLKLERAAAAGLSSSTASHAPATTSRSALAPTVPPSTSTVRRSSSVLAGLHKSQLSVQASTPFASEKQRLSRRSSRNELTEQVEEQEHDLTLPDHDETPSRAAPVASGGGSRRSSSSSTAVSFPSAPTTSMMMGRSVSMASFTRGPEVQERDQRRKSSRDTKENEPPREQRRREMVLA